MARYGCSVSGVALSTTNDLRTLETASALGQGFTIKLYELFLMGEAASSAVARVVVNRPSVAPTGAATNVVPEKINPASVAAVFKAASTYASSQATLSTNDVLIPAFNAFGGIVRWVAPPDSEIIATGTGAAVGQLCVRSRSGTSTVSGHLLVEEV
jgi:hypothetical protein